MTRGIGAARQRREADGRFTGWSRAAHLKDILLSRYVRSSQKRESRLPPDSLCHPDCAETSNISHQEVGPNEVCDEVSNTSRKNIRFGATQRPWKRETRRPRSMGEVSPEGQKEGR